MKLKRIRDEHGFRLKQSFGSSGAEASVTAHNAHQVRTKKMSRNERW